MKQLRIGIVGCGRAAELIYLPALTNFSCIKVTGVVDPVKERSEILSEKFSNCSCYDSVENNFINSIDAAIICTPPQTHVGIATQLLKHDKYVLVEKPLALSMDGVDKLIEIEKNSQASLLMGFNHRYWEPVIRLKEEFPSKDLKTDVEIIFTGAHSNWNPITFNRDPLSDLGPHVFDLVRFIFGKEINSLSAKESAKDNLEIRMTIPGNIIIHSRIAHSDKTYKQITINSGKTIFSVKLGSIRIKPHFGFKRNLLDIKDNLRRKLLKKTSPIKKTYEIQLEKFFNSIRSQTPLNPGIEDGVKAILATQAADISINKNGKVIYLDGN